MTCPNPDCGCVIPDHWHADVNSPSGHYRYFECPCCRQFVVVELEGAE